MANIRSSKKDIRRSLKRKDANTAQRSRLRNFDKKIRALVAAGKTEDAQKEFRVFTTYLDRAGRTNLIHHRQAARRKSRIALLLSKKQAG